MDARSEVEGMALRIEIYRVKRIGGPVFSHRRSGSSETTRRSEMRRQFCLFPSVLSLIIDPRNIKINKDTRLRFYSNWLAVNG